jgi:hypothetical protein
MFPKCTGTSVLVLLTLFFTESTAKAQDHRPTVRAYVYNNAKVSESVLADTAGYVREMFGRAGIELVWVDSMARIREAEPESMDGASHQPGVLRVSLVIVPRPDQIAPKLRDLDEVMGWTPGGQQTRTYVFYERVQAFVLNNFNRIYILRVPRLLAYAVVHELGHLLLPSPNTHSENGIMKSKLDGNDVAELFSDTLGFNSKEAQLMRGEIERRARQEVNR